MIVKILSSAKNFAGISYSERKNEAGASELLCARNFEGLSFQTDRSRADYINYMKAISALNSRVKNRQFHAVISVKGKSASVDKLMHIGEHFLEKMGYGKNPYLIYHHGDTDNTHIHLVSTRVDKNGNKVDDRFEKLRSQKVMHEILSRDPLYEADTALASALSYNFSTGAQFKLLLELQGFKLTEKGRQPSTNQTQWSLIKYGVVQRRIDPEDVQKRMATYRAEDQRAAQLKAIFLKYAMGLSEEQWAKLMKEKFGLDLVFHRKEDKDKPYGYTVVDHPQKNVWKGSQLLSLTELSAKAKDNMVHQLIHELASKPGSSFESLQEELAKLGLKLNQQGAIRIGGRAISLSSGMYHKLKYTDRLHLASSFKINDLKCKSVLGKLMMVNPSDVQIPIAKTNDYEALKAVADYLDQSNKWEQGLKQFTLSLLKDNGQVYLFSPTEPALLDINKLMGRNINPGLTQIAEAGSMTPEHSARIQQSPRGHLLATLLDILAESQQKSPEQKNRKKNQQTLKL